MEFAVAAERRALACVASSNASEYRCNSADQCNKMRKCKILFIGSFVVVLSTMITWAAQKAVMASSSLPPLLSEENKEDNIIDGVVVMSVLLMVQDIICLVLRSSHSQNRRSILNLDFIRNLHRCASSYEGQTTNKFRLKWGSTRFVLKSYLRGEGV